jgi:cytochrome c oxidase subunit II
MHVCRSLRTLCRAVAVVGTALLLAVPLLSESRQDPATASAPKVFEITVRKFEFEPSHIEVTQGDRVRLVVKSGDGVHGLEIKKVKIKKLVPRGGEAVTIEFVAATAGSFEILCSEYCGEGHEDMRGTLIVTAKAK